MFYPAVDVFSRLPFDLAVRFRTVEVRTQIARDWIEIFDEEREEGEPSDAVFPLESPNHDADRTTTTVAGDSLWLLMVPLPIP